MKNFALLLLMSLFLTGGKSPEPIRVQKPTPVYYSLISTCPASLEEFERSLAGDSQSFVKLTSITFNPFHLRSTIIQIYPSHLEVKEFDGSLWYRDTTPSIFRDTFQTHIGALESFEQQLENRVKTLKEFGRRERRLHRVREIMDGELVTIIFGRNGKRVEGVFDNPWGYLAQRKTIRSLNRFKRFAQYMDSCLGRDLVGI